MAKRALLIGANYSGANQLYGCIMDIIQIQGVLIDAYGFKPEEIMVLRDDDPSNMPTKARILSAFDSLVQANPQFVYIHYSGHGTNTADASRDEADGRDECIVPCDYATAGIITDDVINTSLKRLRATGMAVFDCCRSGTIMDWPFQGINTAKSTVSTSGGIYCFSGCQDSELASETVSAVTGLPQGAMTTAFIAVIRRLGYYPAIATLYNEIKRELQTNGFTQVPNLTANIEVTPLTPHPLPQPQTQTQVQAQSTNTLQTQIASLQSQITTLQSQLSSTQSQLTAKQTQITTQQAQLNDLSRQLMLANTQNVALKSQVAQLNASMKQTRAIRK
jgi:hypothetical protein